MIGAIIFITILTGITAYFIIIEVIDPNNGGEIIQVEPRTKKQLWNRH